MFFLSYVQVKIHIIYLFYQPVEGEEVVEAVVSWSPADDLAFDSGVFFGFLFLVCIPSFRMARGLLTPCNLKYNPQALHTGSPSLLRLHKVVVRVPQFVQQSPSRLVAV